jgi:hypothetical protein
MQLVNRAAGRGQSEVQVYRFPNSLRTDRGRRINNSGPDDAGRKCGLELSRPPEEHLPEDLLLAGELVVERPPGDAGGRGQFIHHDGAEAPLQEQALGRFDVRLPRSASRND